MYADGKLWLAQNGSKNVYLYPEMANRHGLIAGASGTGKTVTLRVMAESFSDMGVPVFLADIKGDVGGMCQPGADTEKMRKRIEAFGIDDFRFEGCPVCFWDVYGEKGHPVRTTVKNMGAPLLARLMGLSEVQSDILNIIFHICDDNGWDLVSLNDLRSVVRYVSENTDDYTSKYGTMSPQSLGALQRSLLVLEDLGGSYFFGEPDLDVLDWMRTEKGKGVINILHSVRLAHNPTLYGTFLVWMMTELFNVLPEAGDLDKPKMVFFFDEAHMLFSDAPKMLVDKVEQVVKLIRSKGVGIYFISQSPSDIPDKVLSQLSNRVQHALRAYTPAEQKAVKAAASAFRPNKEFKTEDVILELGVGEALISCLDENGAPSVVERAKILPPKTFLGALPDEEYEKKIKGTNFDKKYGKAVDRPSAEEAIGKLTAEKEKAAAKSAPAKSSSKSSSKSSKSQQTAGQKVVSEVKKEVKSEVKRGVKREVKKEVKKGLKGLFK